MKKLFNLELVKDHQRLEVVISLYFLGYRMATWLYDPIKQNLYRSKY